MPTIPIGERRIGAPSLQAPRRDLAGETAIINAGGEVADMLKKRGQELQNQHDIATAQGFVMEYRGLTREKMIELQQRKGKDAKGVLEEYTDFSTKASDNILKKAENLSQQNILNKYIINRREGDLDDLARHQAMEHYAHMVSNAGLFTQNALDEMGTIHYKNIDGRIPELIEGANLANAQAVSGSDLDMANKKSATAIIYKGIERALQQNPKEAQRLLEKYREPLGAEYIKLKDIVDEEALYREALSLSSNPEATWESMKDFVRAAADSENPPSGAVIDSVLDRVETDEREVKIKSEVERQKIRLDTSNIFNAHMIQRNYGEAMKVAKALQTDNGTMNRLADFTEAEKRRMIADASQGGVLKTSKVAQQGLMRDVLTNKFRDIMEMRADSRWLQLEPQHMTQMEGYYQKYGQYGVTIEDAMRKGEARISEYFGNDPQKLYKTGIVMDDVGVRIRSEEERTGHLLNPDEVKGVIDDMIETKFKRDTFGTRTKTTLIKELLENHKRLQEMSETIGGPTTSIWKYFLAPGAFTGIFTPWIYSDLTKEPPPGGTQEMEDAAEAWLRKRLTQAELTSYFNEATKHAKKEGYGLTWTYLKDVVVKNIGDPLATGNEPKLPTKKE